MYPATTGKVQGQTHLAVCLDEHEGSSLWWKLPGEGYAHPSCGDVRARAWCPTCGTWKHDLLEKCYRAECPVCRTNWIARETKEATERIYQGYYMLKELDRGVRLHHVVWSVPKDEYGCSYEDLRKRFHYRKRVAGSKAGLVVFHPYRFRSVDAGQAVAWKHCSLNPDAESPVIDSYASYEPHFHTLSVGFLITSQEFFERFGWTYKKLHHSKPIFKRNDMTGVIWYALSHAGIHSKYHALSWYGKFSNNQMVVTKVETEYVEMKCDDCGSLLELVYTNPRPVEDRMLDWREDWIIKITKKHWKFK